ncbi:MAG: metalloregulator ArsR/SmtB family transcription factor [Methanomicrobiales archaeon]|jgi:ArsR family transcriptional regulator|nr:metalloregulator ArsR/SmtB family transcription factor [Methanomicrobiales archaeon]
MNECTLPSSLPEEVEQALLRCGGIEGFLRDLPKDHELLKRSALYRALADPIRLKILAMLRDQPLCVCIMKSILGIADSKLSYHLNVLKKAGLIEGGKRGSWIIYSITEAGREFV